MAGAAASSRWPPGRARFRPRCGARSTTETADAPGCTVRFGQGHHIRHWAEGGPTTLSNLAMLCRRHHRAVHEEGFQVERLPDGTLRFRRPTGLAMPDVPEPPLVPDDPPGALRSENEARGLRLTPRSLKPLWYGERLDLGWAIDVLHPLARRRQGETGGTTKG